MVCQYKFHGNPQNYVSDRDHDENTRKMWFVVFGEGLFTKKTDADTYALKNDVVNDDSVHIFNTKAQALCCWARHCRRRHANGCHNSADTSEYESDADSDTDHDTEAPALRARVVARVPTARTRNQPATAPIAKRKREGSMKPIVKRKPAVLMKGEPVVKAETLSVKREGKPVMMGPPTISSRRSASVRPKRAQSGSAQTAPAPARVLSPKLPLYVDDTDDDLFASYSEMSVPLAASRANMRALFPHHEFSFFADGYLVGELGVLRSFSLDSRSSLRPGFQRLSRGFPCAWAFRRTAASCSISIHELGDAASVHAFQKKDTRSLHEVGVEEMQPGDSMQVVERGDVASWMSSMSG
ncbi:hypothetical protein K438DRAFT_1972964 [Mycena galopus ATCC 62051]|nr:hypothetical protein K438DRAFT_1972964 [Mycena galopus ATCC 62051]